MVTDEIIDNYVEFLLQGYTLDCMKVRVGTILGYLRVMNKHYRDNRLQEPFVKSGDTDAAIMLTAQEKFERIPAKRNPLTHAMCVKMCELARDADPLGFRATAWNWTALGRYGGFRAQEFGMDSPKKVKHYVLPDGTLVVRAFTQRNFKCYDVEGTRLSDALALANRAQVHATGQEYDVQKNRQNGEEITVARLAPNDALDAGPMTTKELCGVENTLEIKTRAIMLGYSEPEDPLCVYQDEKSEDVLFLTGTKMTEYYRFILKLVQPSVTDEELSLISTHSLRVYACVLLHEAGKDGPYIKIRLRWLSDCYVVYLRNTDTIRLQHNEAMTGSHAMMAKLVVDAIANGQVLHVKGATNLDMDDLEDED